MKPLSPADVDRAAILDAAMERLRRAERTVRRQLSNPKSGAVGSDAFIELVRAAANVLAVYES